MLYKTCPHCNSNNDPGEVCECQRRDFQHRAETRESKQAATAERRAEGVRNGKRI